MSKRQKKNQLTTYGEMENVRKNLVSLKINNFK